LFTMPGAGLPDFSWYSIPKRWKYTKWPQNIPKCHKIYQNVRKIYQMSIKFTSIFHCKTLKNLPKVGFLFWQ
jgi:hypothetical protein